MVTLHGRDLDNLQSSQSAGAFQYPVAGGDALHPPLAGLLIGGKTLQAPRVGADGAQVHEPVVGDERLVGNVLSHEGDRAQTAPVPQGR